MHYAIRGALIGALAFLSCATVPAFAGSVSALRVMLHPYTAAPGEWPATARASLEAIVASPLTLVGTTRTGALELALPAPVSDDVAAALVKELRVDRGVLWAEPIVREVAARSAAVIDADREPGRRLLVRLRDDATPDLPSLLARLSALVGTPLTLVRQIAQVYVLETGSQQSIGTLRTMAQLIQTQPEVRYADPVRRVTAFAAPDDPYYPLQWGLHNPVAGVNAETAWTLQPDLHGITVAVVDTGILPHPDLVGRVLPGYDFISDPGRARDGDARDPNPRDEGDWSAGDCGGADFPSFFHGLFVSGVIAANSNNGIGIAGVASGVQILPVRVLGKCGGTFEDVLEGMLWASGVPIAGVPPNQNPAKVINLSLGGYGACDQAMQEAVDLALAQGSVIVAAAGNSSLEAADVAPANCSGVITVGAHGAQGELTSYSNFGRRIDLTAPGGDRPLTDLIFGLTNDGATVPTEPSYGYAAGTSFAAPLVSGVAAMLIARDSLITGGRVLDLLTGTAHDWPPGSPCLVPNVCGAGMLDAASAVGSLLPGGGAPPPGTTPVVEYYRSDLDHYFITADPAEAAWIDASLGDIFKRTGLYFYAWLDPATAPADVQPVCRFYANADTLINSHYYSANFDECLAVLLNWPGVWDLETANAFYIQIPDAGGSCPQHTLPVYRFFNGRQDANHRYTVDLSVRRGMNNRAWVAEGSGTEAVVFCSPI
ncbi:MAG: S8 family peptidase [Burkholderiales bacterium]|nr:S8 family peptidase [Burkholderiales bacterium]